MDQTPHDMSHILTPWQKDPAIEVQKYSGGCHCGEFAYEFKYPAVGQSKPNVCSCSMCHGRGYYIAYVVYLSN